MDNTLSPGMCSNEYRPELFEAGYTLGSQCLFVQASELFCYDLTAL